MYIYVCVCVCVCVRFLHAKEASKIIHLHSKDRLMRFLMDFLFVLNWIGVYEILFL